MVDPYAVAQDALKLVQLIVRKCDEVKALKTELTPLKDNLESLGGILRNVGEVHYETIPPLSTILRSMLTLLHGNASVFLIGLRLVKRFDELEVKERPRYPLGQLQELAQYCSGL